MKQRGRLAAASFEALPPDFDGDRLRAVDYRDTEHFRVTRDFLENPERFFRYLFDNAPTDFLRLDDVSAGEDGETPEADTPDTETPEEEEAEEQG